MRHIPRLTTTFAFLFLWITLPPLRAQQEAPPTEVFTVQEPGGRTFEYRMTFLRDTPRYRVYRLTYPSAVQTDLESNNTIPAEYYLPHGIEPGDPQRPAVICLHILGGNFELVRLLCAVFADRGIPAVMFKLPYYGERADRSVHRLLQNDATVFAQALDQGTADVERTFHLLASRPEVNPERIGVSGISLGAIVGATSVGRLPNVWRAGLLLGGGDLDTIIHHARETRGLSEYIRKQPPEGQAGIKQAIAELDPLRYGERLRELGQNGRLLMINASEDEVIPRGCTDRLAEAACVTDQVVWLDGLAHYTAMAALPGIVEQLGEFFARDLPEGITLPADPEPAELPPEHRLARFVRELLVLIGPPPTEGRCHLIHLEAEVTGKNGKSQNGRLELVRGHGERFRLACQLPKIGGASFGNGSEPWLQSENGRCFVGSVGDAGGRPLLAYLDPQFLLKIRVGWGALSAMTVSPNAFREYLKVTVEKQENNQEMLVIELNHRHAKGRGELLFAADGTTPVSLHFTGDGASGTIHFRQWQIDTLGTEELFRPPTSEQKEVSREDIYRMFAAVFAFAGESIQ
jgi:dienelactone hydrolase